MVDTIDLGLALGRLASPPGCIGIHIPFGRLDTQETTGAPGQSYETAIELMARSASAVSRLAVITAQGRHSSSPASTGCFVTATLAAALSDIDTAWTGFSSTGQNYNDGLSGGATLSAGETVNRRRYLVSDFQTVIPKARTDGGADRPLAVGRAFIGSAGIATPGDNISSLTNWGSRAAGAVRMRKNGGGGNTTDGVSGWGSAGSTSPVVGFVYTHDGPIVNVFGNGDSIDDGFGNGITYLGANVNMLACEAINADSPASWVSYANIAWSGRTSTAFVNSLRDAVGAGLVPDVLITPAGSPNDITIGQPITSTIVELWRSNLSQVLEVCAQHGICPIIRPVYPVNYSVHQWGSSDALRIAYNAEIQAMCAVSGLIFLDDLPDVTGPTDGNGQATLLGTSDGIHPDDSGKAILLPKRSAAIKQAMGAYL